MTGFGTRALVGCPLIEPGPVTACMMGHSQARERQDLRETSPRHYARRPPELSATLPRWDEEIGDLEETGDLKEQEHSRRLDRVQTFFQLGMPTMAGYNALGEIATRYALKLSLAQKLKEVGAIPPALKNNPCFVKSSGHFGVALLDAPNTTEFAEGLYLWVVNPAFQKQNLRQLASHCLLRDRINHMLDMLAPDNPEFVTNIGNQVAAISMSNYDEGVQFQVARRCSAAHPSIGASYPDAACCFGPRLTSHWGCAHAES